MRDICQYTNEPDITTVLHAIASKNSIPLSGTFELTDNCCFSCKMCYIHGTNHTCENELSTIEWLKIAQEAKNSGMIFLLLTGGEPLIRKDFVELYSSLAQMGFVISINTNGYLLKDEIADILMKFPPSRLNISLYGADNETYKDVCGGEYFDTVKANIIRMKKCGINIKLNCTITGDNCSNIEKIDKFSKELDLNIKAVTYMYPPTRKNNECIGINSGRMTPEQSAYYRIYWNKIHFDNFTERMENLISSVKNTHTTEQDNINVSKCRAGRTSFWIDYKGNMSSCGMINGRHNVLQNEFVKCWDAVRTETDMVRLPKECLLCSYRSICNVCMAVCLCETGRTDKAPEYVCNFTKSTYDYAKKVRGE